MQTIMCRVIRPLPCCLTTPLTSEGRWLCQTGCSSIHVPTEEPCAFLELHAHSWVGTGLDTSAYAPTCTYLLRSFNLLILHDFSYSAFCIIIPTAACLQFGCLLALFVVMFFPA